MLPVTADHLARELREARNKLRAYCDAADELVEGYHGTKWKKGSEKGERFESHAYEYASLMLPRLAHELPSFELNALQGGKLRVVTRFLERGLNRWPRASRLHEPLEEIALDALFSFGGAYIEEVPNDQMRLSDEERSRLKGSMRRRKSVAGEYPDDPERPHLPRVRRLEPGRWFWDVAATSEAGIRYFGHLVTEDKNELIRKAEANPDDWHLDRVRDLVTLEDGEELGYSEDGRQTPARDQVTYAVIWVPDARLEDDPEADEHGVIYTLEYRDGSDGASQGSFIRRPYYFYGPPQGPYVRMGFYKVPRSTVPLSPLLATADISDMVGRVNRSVVRRIEKYRRGVLYPLKDKKDVERIAASQDDDMIGVTGLDQSVQTFEIGGLSAQDSAHVDFLRSSLYEASGMDDARRGNVTGRGTATEVAVASESSEMRVAFLERKWSQFVADCAERVAWYGAHDDRVVFRYFVPEDERQEFLEGVMDTNVFGETDEEKIAAAMAFMQTGSATYYGGDFGENGLSFDDVELRIEPASMQRSDARTRKIDVVEGLNLITQFSAAAVQGVPIDLAKVAELLAEVYAMPELEEVVRGEGAEALGILAAEERMSAMEQQAAAASAPQGGSNVPSQRREGPAGMGGGGRAPSAAPKRAAGATQ